MVILASCNRAALWAYARQPQPRMHLIVLHGHLGVLQQGISLGVREATPAKNRKTSIPTTQISQSGASWNRNATPLVWHFCGPGEDSEHAKTPLCNSWRHGFARSRGDLTICVARGGDSSSRFLFREAVSDLRRPGSAH